MGSIVYIEKNPHKWKQIDDGLHLKSDPTESLVKVSYGEFDDDPLGTHDLEILMRRSVYEKLVSGEYRIERNAGLLKECDFCVLDRNGKLV